MHRLDVLFGADGGDGSIDIFESHLTRTQQAVNQVFVTVKIAFHLLVGCLKARISDLCCMDVLSAETTEAWPEGSG